MPDRAAPYGMLGQFGSADELTAAARAARRDGYRRLEAFTPFPVEELAEVLGIEDRRLGYVFYLGGLAGLAAALAVIWAVNIDYGINVGGRPVFAFPAFMVVGVELTILGAVLFGVVGMFVLNRLPRLHHPVFEARDFTLASDDRFFLCVLGDDPRFDPDATRAFLTTLSARTVQLVAA